MKVRLGFVSNSSSASFCVYGFYIDYKEYDSMLQRDRNELDESVSVCSHGSPNNDRITMLGRSYITIEDNETGKDFKNSVENAIRNIIGFDKNLEIHQEGWYDG